MHAVAFETAHPAFRPKSQRAFFAQIVTQKRLLVAEILLDLLKVVCEIVQYIRMSADFEAIYRGIAQAVTGFPLANDQYVSLLREKFIQTAGDDDVNVEKQGVAVQVV